MLKENFWDQLEKPFFIQAPMAEVTDIVFREFIAHIGRPDVFYTEFVSCRGLLSEKGRKNLIRDLYYTENQRPIVGQIFGGEPGDFYETARLLARLGFDGVDINMGCPDKKVEKQGAGAALIRDQKRAQDIISATQEGAGKIPVSVKTRIGYNTIETEKWLGAVLEKKPAALIVHGRTRKEMSKVDAHWEEIGKAAKMARETHVAIIGNGDVESKRQGEAFAEKFSLDGIMIGRGMFGAPDVFSQPIPCMSVDELLISVTRLALTFDGFWKGIKNFDILKCHFKAYVHGFPEAKELRVQLMATHNAQEVKMLMQRHFEKQGKRFPSVEPLPVDLNNLFLREESA